MLYDFISCLLKRLFYGQSMDGANQLQLWQLSQATMNPYLVRVLNLYDYEKDAGPYPDFIKQYILLQPKSGLNR